MKKVLLLTIQLLFWVNSHAQTNKSNRLSYSDSRSMGDTTTANLKLYLTLELTDSTLGQQYRLSCGDSKGNASVVNELYELQRDNNGNLVLVSSTERLTVFNGRVLFSPDLSKENVKKIKWVSLELKDKNGNKKDENELDNINWNGK